MRHNLQELAAQAKDVRANLAPEALAEIAALVLILHQQAARGAGAILPAHMLRTYAQRDEGEREGMRAAVEHVVVALVLLGVIDKPGG